MVEGGEVVEVQPVLVDTQAAALAVHVSPGTVRAWASRGKLERKGQERGRTLYDLADVYAAAERAGLSSK
ncbi:MerR-like transcriptional regulator [Arthrobacter phage Kuleana]|uniref:MerR-like helix-turn-helix DNA binding domain protein n=1 Tax=Arthrobacter phage Kuleana TaxID=2653270 RepID=A0A5Q2W8Q0_9CAUD|nr:MerR-like transcriptional regulator [Arthrobacter phage Kuleana]QGH74562.1 MerR-like helix-turn-helix DNA binding domain protein [Arthrobacter phage Kuleana]